MISIVDPVELEHVLRPTVYRPGGARGRHPDATAVILMRPASGGPASRRNRGCQAGVSKPVYGRAACAYH